MAGDSGLLAKLRRRPCPDPGVTSARALVEVPGALPFNGVEALCPWCETSAKPMLLACGAGVCSRCSGTCGSIGADPWAMPAHACAVCSTVLCTACLQQVWLQRLVDNARTRIQNEASRSLISAEAEANAASQRLTSAQAELQAGLRVEERVRLVQTNEGLQEVLLQRAAELQAGEDEISQQEEALVQLSQQLHEGSSSEGGAVSSASIRHARPVGAVAVVARAISETDAAKARGSTAKIAAAGAEMRSAQLRAELSSLRRLEADVAEEDETIFTKAEAELSAIRLRRQHEETSALQCDLGQPPALDCHGSEISEPVPGSGEDHRHAPLRQELVAWQEEANTQLLQMNTAHDRLSQINAEVAALRSEAERLRSVRGENVARIQSLRAELGEEKSDLGRRRAALRAQLQADIQLYYVRMLAVLAEIPPLDATEKLESFLGELPDGCSLTKVVEVVDAKMSDIESIFGSEPT